MPKDARYSRKLRAGRAGACVARWTVLSDAREWVLGLVSFIYKQVSEWRTLLARLRRARLLAGEDPLQPGQLDAHPLVREYFGEQLRALHEVYLPRIQRGDAAFAAKVLGARGALLSILAHFFEDGRWGLPAQGGVEGQRLTAEDQLLILMQTGMYLTVTRGLGTPESRVCYERAEALCHLLDRPLSLYSALMGQWVFSLHTDNPATTMQIAKRVYTLAEEQNDAALMLGAYRALAVTRYYLGDFEPARQYADPGCGPPRGGGNPRDASAAREAGGSTIGLGADSFSMATNLAFDLVG